MDKTGSDAGGENICSFVEASGDSLYCVIIVICVFLAACSVRNVLWYGPFPWTLGFPVPARMISVRPGPLPIRDGDRAAEIESCNLADSLMRIPRLVSTHFQYQGKDQVTARCT